MVEILILSLRVFQALLLAAAVLVVIWLVFLSLPGLMRGAPFVGTRPESLKAMLDLAVLRSGETVVDLGSGDGRLLFAAARAGCRAVGYEINLFLVWSSRWRAWRLGLSPRVTVRWGSFWKARLDEADVVLVFGFSNIMADLAKKLADELRPGARVVSLRYELSAWPAAGRSGEARLYLKK